MFYNSIVNQIMFVTITTTHACAFHIDLTTLADGTWAGAESESEKREAQVNLTEITKDLNQSSEEPKASSAQEGKPRSMSYLL